MTRLTARQRQVLEILIRTTEDGCQASTREILLELGLSPVSTNAYSEWLDALEGKRFVRRQSTENGAIKQRAIAILLNPDGSEYVAPGVRYRVLCQALGCAGKAFDEVLAVARSRRVA